MIHIPMLEWQSEFCADIDTPELGLIGGLGSGKTIGFCNKGMILAAVNTDGPQTVTRGGLCEPTQHLMRTHLLPNFQRQLDLAEIKSDWHSSEGIMDLKFAGGNFPILLTSAENYERIVGHNWAFIGFEELDTSNFEIAKAAYAKGKERIRWGKHRQIFTTSTIEGIKFLQHHFVDKAGPHKRTIHANSELNPLLSAEYLEGLKHDMSPEEYAVRVQGNWGSIRTNLVYPNYVDKPAPDGNITDRTIHDFPQGDIIHAGMDFNAGKCATTVHMIEEDNGVPYRAYVVDELNTADNQVTIHELRARYKGRQIWCYPDTSGDNANYIGYDTALEQLRNSGFTVKLNSRAKAAMNSADVKGKGSNPFVGDRIKSMNNLMLNTFGQRRYLVNKVKCPALHKSLQRQMWIEKGGSRKPDKSNDVDHPLDSTGYLVFKYWPPRAGGPTFRTQ